MEGVIAEITRDTERHTEDAADLLSRPAARRVIVVGGLLAALLFRLFVVLGPLGALDADEAVSGLMARHILEGELPVFYWGQNYGGTGEIFLTAALFAVIDSSTAALRVIPFVLFSATAVVIWKIGQRFFGEPGASVAAVLFLVWPAYLVWKSLQAHGYYGLLILLSAIALFIALEVRKAPTLRRYALLGLTLGLGLWTSPQIVLIGIPVVLWLLAQRATRHWKGLGVMVGGFVAGSAPWWIWNALHQWSSVLDRPDLPHSTYGDHLVGLVTHVIPAGLGLRVSGGDWLVPGWAGWLCYAAVLAIFIWYLVRNVRDRDPRLSLLTLTLLTFPWLYALSPHAWFIAEPRYMLLLFPIICLIVGWGFNRSYAVRIFTVALALPVTALGLAGMNSLFKTAPDFAVQTRSTRLTSVIDVLRKHDVRYVIADYWLAYPISFETREEIVATSSGHVRHVPHDELVRSQPHPAYVFITGDEKQEAFERSRVVNHPGYQRVRTGEYTVYVYQP